MPEAPHHPVSSGVGYTDSHTVRSCAAKVSERREQPSHCHHLKANAYDSDRCELLRSLRRTKGESRSGISKLNGRVMRDVRVCMQRTTKGQRTKDEIGSIGYIKFTGKVQVFLPGESSQWAEAFQLCALVSPVRVEVADTFKPHGPSPLLRTAYTCQAGTYADAIGHGSRPSAG